MEGTGCEPSVPLLLLGVANRRRLQERRSHLQVQVRDGYVQPNLVPLVDELGGDVFEGLVDIAVQQFETEIETLHSGLFQ